MVGNIASLAPAMPAVNSSLGSWISPHPNQVRSTFCGSGSTRRGGPATTRSRRGSQLIASVRSSMVASSRSWVTTSASRQGVQQLSSPSDLQCGRKSDAGIPSSRSPRTFTASIALKPSTLDVLSEKRNSLSSFALGAEIGGFQTRAESTRFPSSCRNSFSTRGEGGPSQRSSHCSSSSPTASTILLPSIFIIAPGLFTSNTSMPVTITGMCTLKVMNTLPSLGLRAVHA
mmetsp:Transcript_9167/g.22100  ORF Transcript_9167/g.22100 Transcript_9167/m.22100 type:complete len:230 (-) Transcript_9167:625-1314(-)